MTNFQLFLTPRLTNFTIKNETRTRELSFGDGYKETASDGINSTRKQTRVSIIVNKTALDSYLAIFADLQGAKPFLWSPDGSPTTDLWICKNWEYSKLSPNYFELIADFVQYFSP